MYGNDGTWRWERAVVTNLYGELALAWPIGVNNRREIVVNDESFSLGQWIRVAVRKPDNDVLCVEKIESQLPTSVSPQGEVFLKTRIIFPNVNDEFLFAYSEDLGWIGYFFSFPAIDTDCMYDVWVTRTKGRRKTLGEKHASFWSVVKQNLVPLKRLDDDKKTENELDKEIKSEISEEKEATWNKLLDSSKAQNNQILIKNSYSNNAKLDIASNTKKQASEKSIHHYMEEPLDFAPVKGRGRSIPIAPDDTELLQSKEQCFRRGFCPVPTKAEITPQMPRLHAPTFSNGWDSYRSRNHSNDGTFHTARSSIDSGWSFFRPQKPNNDRIIRSSNVPRVRTPISTTNPQSQNWYASGMFTSPAKNPEMPQISEVNMLKGTTNLQTQKPPTKLSCKDDALIFGTRGEQIQTARKQALDESHNLLKLLYENTEIQNAIMNSKNSLFMNELAEYFKKKKLTKNFCVKHEDNQYCPHALIAFDECKNPRRSVF